MKIFTIRFATRTIIVAAGLLLLIINLLELFFDMNHAVYNLALIVIGVVVVKLGRTIAKDEPPAHAKASIDILRKAGVLPNTHEKRRR